MVREKDNRKTQVAIAAVILGTISICVLTLVIGWRSLPGVLGEWLGILAGIISTPFFLEATFAVLGLVIVMTLNHWHSKREGDEFVYLDQVDEPEAKRLPDHSKWAIYQKPPVSGEEPSLMEMAEGAVAIGDFEVAADLIGAMGKEELQQTRTLELRRELARVSGKDELAKRLDQEIEARRRS